MKHCPGPGPRPCPIPHLNYNDFSRIFLMFSIFKRIHHQNGEPDLVCGVHKWLPLSTAIMFT